MIRGEQIRPTREEVSDLQRELKAQARAGNTLAIIGRLLLHKFDGVENALNDQSTQLSELNRRMDTHNGFMQDITTVREFEEVAHISATHIPDRLHCYLPDAVQAEIKRTHR